MFNDINRHIMVVWQSVGVLIGAFAIFALVEKHIINVDVAVSIIVLLAAWLIAHLIDANYWYNRNLAIIANIERQFFTQADLRHVHYYFGAHRPKNRMIAHLKIQVALGFGLVFIMILYHIGTRIIPMLLVGKPSIELSMLLPYVLLIASLFFLRWLRQNRNRSYEEFLQNSPGIEINAEGIHYGIGHGFHDA
jgi:hypothetical protein